MMSFNIEEFKSALNKYGGLSKPYNFQVIIPTNIVSGSNMNSADLSIFCENVNLPGINLQTNEFKYTGYGKLEKRPYLNSFTDLNMTLLIDGNEYVKEFFDKWINKISNFTENSGDNKDTFKYPNEYVVDLEIVKFHSTGEEISRYKIYRAFPITIGDINLAWSEKGNVTRMPIQMAYLSWSNDKIGV